MACEWRIGFAESFVVTRGSSSLKRLLFVIDSLGPGGAERSLVDILPALMNSGVAPTIVCLQRASESFEAEARASGASVRVLTRAHRAARILELRRLIRELGPDLIHTTLIESDIVGRIAAVGSGVPVSTSLVNTSYDPVRLDDPNVRRWRLEVTRRVDGWTARHLTKGFHAISRVVANAAAEDLGIDPGAVTVIPRGRNLTDFEPTHAESRSKVLRDLALHDHSEIVINVARQEFQKGQTYLLEALHLLEHTRPNLRLLIVGREGNASAMLQEQVSRLELENRVHFLGHRSDVPDLLMASDLFAFPSLYEGLGGALIEAMAAGLPIVASDIPALRETLTARGSRFVPPRATAALAGAIVEVLDAPEQRRAMSDENRRHSKDYDIERTTDRMVEFFRVTSTADR